MAQLLITNHTRHTRNSRTGLYLLDTTYGAVRQLYERSVNGVTRGPGGYYFIEPEGDLYFLEPSDWRYEKRLETGYIACHDLRWIDGYFYLVASKGNRIVRLDGNLRILDQMQVVEDEEDICHANCIAEADGRLLLSIFTLSPGSRRDKNRTEAWRREGKILRLDWERKSYDILYEPLCQPHSLVYRDGLLYLCESLNSEVSVVSLEKRTHQRLRRLHGFVRGLAIAGGSAFVGISRRKIGRSLVDQLLGRFRMACGVIELDAKTWKPKRSFRLPGWQVYEIIVADED